MKQQVIAVTGCSSGLGRAVALKLHGQNHYVYAGVRNLASVHQTPPIFHQLDIVSEENVNNFLDTIKHKHDSIDCLVNNAAVCLIGAIDACTIEEARSIFEINVIGTLNISNRVIDLMKERGRGRIVFITSISGVESSSFLGLYSATKFALEAIALSYAATLHKWNIEVIIVQPGAMNTPLPNKVSIGSRYHNGPDPYKRFHQNSLNLLKEILSKGISPEEAAEKVIEAIFAPRPKLRYQTNDYSRELVHRHLIDPQEVNWIKNERQLVDSLF